MASGKNKSNYKFICFIKRHKVISGLVLGCFAVALVGVGLIAYNNARMAGTYKALEYADKGYLTEDELKDIEANGGLVMGEEIVDPNTGETYVLSKDENGNVISTVVKDSQGNDTGAVVPGGSSSSGGQAQGKGQPSGGHQHTWVAHAATRQVPHTSYINHPAVTHQAYYQVCNLCGRRLAPNEGACHCNGHANSCHGEYETVVDKAAWTEAITEYTSENYVDYYYCSECGTQG